MISVRLLQFRKARKPIAQTDYGIVRPLRFLQSSNALSPILVIQPSMITVTRFLLSEKAQSPMLVTPPPINTVCIEFLKSCQGGLSHSKKIVISPLPDIVRVFHSIPKSNRNQTCRLVLKQVLPAQPK